jgi:hypothetical protein
MTFASVPGTGRRLGFSVYVGLLLLAAAPVRVSAALLTYHLDGHVTRLLETKAGTLNALAVQGVKKDVAVSIDWTVDTSIPFHSESTLNHSKEYIGNITAFKIQVGSWMAVGGDPGVTLNKIDIRDDANDPNSLETMDMFRSGTDTPNLLMGSDPNGVQLIVHLFNPNGGSSTDNVLGDQTPSLYPSFTGTVFGANGEVDFSIGASSTPPPDPTVKCRSAQIASAAALCQSTLKCLAVRAKQTPAQIAKNPGSLQTCEDKASAKFVTAFDKATAAAAKKGLSCGTTEPAATFVEHFESAVDDVVAVVDTITPPSALLSSSWYSDAAGMCAAAVKAESKDVKKPSPATLDQLRATARAKATTVANKAIAKAESKGVVFDPAPDVTALVSSIDALIDDIVTELNGP